jgi:hypothetical protein
VVLAAYEALCSGAEGHGRHPRIPAAAA